MILNGVVVVLWGVNVYLRVEGLRTETSVPVGLVGLSAFATLLLLISGYLGGRMIYAYGINVARLSKKKWREIAQEGRSAVPPESEG